MGVDWFSSYKPIDYRWVGLGEGVTLWKRWKVLPKGVREFEDIPRPDGSVEIHTKTFGEDEEVSYLSFRASSYPSLNEKVNIIVRYLLNHPDSELVKWLEDTIKKNAESIENARKGMAFFNTVLTLLGCLGEATDMKISVGGSMERLELLGDGVRGVIFFRDIKWQECKYLWKLFEEVSRYCEERLRELKKSIPEGAIEVHGELAREIKFWEYHAKYFWRGSNFFKACFLNKANVHSSY